MSAATTMDENPQLPASVRRRDDQRTVAGQHRLMRRADREVTDPDQIGAIIGACSIVHVSYADDEGLTIVPVNFGYEYGPYGSDANTDVDGDAGARAAAHADAEPSLTLYMHSAPAGRKIDALNASGNALQVAFSLETDYDVIVGRTLCNWGESFKSVIGTGTASIVESLEERRKGLQLLMKQQAHMPHADFTDQQVLSVVVWRIQATHLTAKIRNKPDATHHANMAEAQPDDVTWAGNRARVDAAEQGIQRVIGDGAQPGAASC